MGLFLPKASDCYTLGKDYVAVAWWHTHPSSGGPSPADKKASKQLGLPGFVTRRTWNPFDGNADVTKMFGESNSDCPKK